jgi:hypothetical protein
VSTDTGKTTARDEIAKIAAANNWFIESTSSYSIYTRDKWRVLVMWSWSGTVTKAVLGEEKRDHDDEIWYDMNNPIRPPDRRQKVIDILQEPRTGERK